MYTLAELQEQIEKIEEIINARSRETVISIAAIAWAFSTATDKTVGTKLISPEFLRPAALAASAIAVEFFQYCARWGYFWHIERAARIAERENKIPTPMTSVVRSLYGFFLLVRIGLMAAAGIWLAIMIKTAVP